MSDIVSRSCMFSLHIPISNTKYEDVHMVKERITYQDGSIKPNLRFIKNFKRPFWVVKPELRNYNEKKEYEDMSNLIQYSSTESALRDNVAKAIGKRGSRDYLRQLLNSPYVYGADVPSESLIKNMYREKYPDYVSTYEVSMLDTETDVLHGTEEIILITVTYRNIIYTAVVKDYIKNIENPVAKERELVDKYLGDKIDTTQYEFILDIATSPMDAVAKAFDKLHEYKPDFVAIWNMEFDLNKILETCNKYGVDPKNLFSDPKVPEELRYFKYKRGSTFKVTASGKRKPKAPYELWNTVISTSSFYFIDAMCAYKYIRLSKAEEPSYSLDAILNKELKLGKLKFDEAKMLENSIEWHRFMQEKYPLEYIVYNRFDCISMILLDNKTNDLKAVVPVFSGLSPFSYFNSQPKLIGNSLYFFLLSKDKVLATVGTEEPKRDANGKVIIEEEADYVDEEDDDEEYESNNILSLKKWTVVLPNAFMDDSSFADVIKENVTNRSNVRTYIYDFDAVSSYPSDLISLNISKATTSKEIVDIKDEKEISIDEDLFRKQNINLLYGHTNALEYCVNMFNFPRLNELLTYANK